MKEHESTDRLFAGGIISLAPMNRDELEEIIKVAECQINGYITFRADARNRLVDLAQGHPYMIHLLGKYALRSAYTNGVTVITAKDIEKTLQSIAETSADPVLEGRYRKAVASSTQREQVLRAMAEERDEQGEIWTTNAYKTALDHGVENSSQYVGQLVTEEYGAEIQNLRERYYRFKDSLFAAYVKAHPQMIQDR
jgi:hypothetical protein